MDLQDARHLLIFGGSFDPPHRAHVELPEQVRRAIDADLIVYVPAGRSPHKVGRSQTPAHHRVRMLELALQGRDRVWIERDELERAGADEPSYTVDTLERLRKRVGAAVRMRLLLGADQAVVFERWHRPERVAELAEPVVMLRPPQTRQALLERFEKQQRPIWERRIVQVDAMQISASDVRQRVARGASIQGLVSPAVARYIATHGLYRDFGDSD